MTCQRPIKEIWLHILQLFKVILPTIVLLHAWTQIIKPRQETSLKTLAGDWSVWTHSSISTNNLLETGGWYAVQVKEPGLMVISIHLSYPASSK